MNRYIDHLTVEEYNILIRLLNKYKPLEEENMKRAEYKKDYIDLRYLTLKMQGIVKKYSKK